MNRALSLLAVFAFGLALFASPALAKGTVGFRTGLALDPDDFVVGIHFRTDLFGENFYFVPSLEVGFGDVTMIAGNADLHYVFNTNSKLKPYVGGGITLNWFDGEGNNDSETDFGGSILGGIKLTPKMFLEAKLGQTAALERSLGCSVPVALMTSFATDHDVREHIVARGLGELLVFNQFVSLRLDCAGELFRDEEGRASPYAPGHGDLLRAIRDSGVLGALRERGVEVVTVSNVDNLGARVDPTVVGMHLLGGCPLTCEVALKEGDPGGAPVRVDGRLQLVEGPRFPPSFDQSSVPVFNTNTALVSLDALDREYELTWLHVGKEVDGRAAVQLERVYHEISRHLPTTYLEVPRRGPRGRFLPIKTPRDLEAAQEDLRELLASVS